MRIATGVIGWCAAAVVAAPSASAACADEDLVPDAGNLERIRAAVVCLHNEERRASGVRPLRSHGRLDAAALEHSADMVARRYFDHETPDGRDPFERMKGARYIRSSVIWNAGENIAWASGALATPRSIFDAWMRSTGHRLTLLASDFSELGVGIALGAPDPARAHLTVAATYTVDFGWREAKRKRASRSCRGTSCRKRSRGPRRT